MTPGELLQEDKLSLAVEASLTAVKKKPADADARFLLGELLCVAGQMERADRQFETLATQNPQSIMRISLVRQLIRAEQARRQLITGGRLPDFLVEPTPLMKLHLDAVIALREGNREAAAEALDQVEQQRPRLAGTCNGESFDDFRDLDDTFSSIFEVLTSTGKYYLISMDTVQRIDFHPIERPLDLIWRQVHMVVDDGPDGEVYMPAIYASTYDQATDPLLLGRSTEWLGDTPPVTGIGQRVFLTGEHDKGIGELKSVQFSGGA